jgi:hypothetical protein
MRGCFDGALDPQEDGVAAKPPAASPSSRLPDASAAPGRSSLASELRQLPERLRKTLELRDWVIDTVDVMVSALIALAEPADSRTVEERFGWLLAEHSSDDADYPSEEFDRELAEWTERLNAISETELPRWTRRLAGDGSWKRFARKLLGARSYDRLARAIRGDLSAVAGGFRRLVQIAQPFAVAFDDLVSVLTPEQIKGVDNTYDWAAISALRFLLQLDTAIGRYIESSFDWSSFQLDKTAVEQSDFAEMAQRLRGAAVGPTRERLAELNARLASKISGAQDALRLSADGVSQAAHSLVELIDRMLRTAFPNSAVMSWIDDSARNDDGLTYIAEDGSQRPTKRAQALCFAYGGRPANQKSAIHEMVATGLVSARTQLQELKHADQGNEAEVRRVTSLMAAVEGFLTLALRIGWATLDEEEVDGLRRRLAA